MSAAIDNKSLDILFREARTYNGWQKKPVDSKLLQDIYDLYKWGPTSANCEPLRIVFVQSAEAKEKLKSCLQAGNVDKTMAAPVTAILANDMEFYEKLPKLFPHADARAWFVGNQKLISDTAFRNGSLQAAYFMLAARAFGLDCGAMSGFDQAKCDEMFFAGTSYKSNFLCNLGYGDKASLFPRSPRLDFSEACKIV
ncbi:MAG: malonic semialdehyde reductase [Alphaproteobacteria bacterium]|nr:MAG: malonic semialdehyde reductase [Alphaproteobacteria bacterium]